MIKHKKKSLNKEVQLTILHHQEKKMTNIILERNRGKN